MISGTEEALKSIGLHQSRKTVEFLSEQDSWLFRMDKSNLHSIADQIGKYFQNGAKFPARFNECGFQISSGNPDESTCLQ